MMKDVSNASPDVLPHLPLNPKTFMVLLALAEEATHGYEIKKKAEAQSGGSIRLDAGSLYRTLAKLEERGLVEEAEERPDPADDDPRRRYYQLTGLGSRVLCAEAERLRSMVAAVPEAHLVTDHGASA